MIMPGLQSLANVEACTQTFGGRDRESAYRYLHFCPSVTADFTSEGQPDWRQKEHPEATNSIGPTGNRPLSTGVVVLDSPLNPSLHT